jgi:hypothetical protein
MRKYFTLADITKRILLALPVRFTKEESSNVYKFFESMADSFYIDTEKIDELIAQTNISSASGDYLDEYIQGLAGFGRLKSSVQDVLDTEDYQDITDEENVVILTPEYQHGVKESDPAYKDRFINVLYNYNSTKDGIKNIVIDFAFQEPKEMNTGVKRGAFYSAPTSHSKNFYNDPGYSHYGSFDIAAFTGFIELSQKPDDDLLEQLCIHIQNAKAYGIQIYVKYPLVGILDGSYVYTISDEIVTRDTVSANQTTQTQTVTATDSLTYIIINV